MWFGIVWVGTVMALAALAAFDLGLEGGLLGGSGDLIEARRCGEVGEDHCELPARGQTTQQALGAAVAVVRREHGLAGLHQLEHERDRRHAGAGDHRADTALEIVDGIGEVRPRCLNV